MRNLRTIDACLLIQFQLTKVIKKIKKRYFEMKVEVIAWLTLVGLHFNSVHGCECSGRPEVVKECQNSTQNNFLETCICDGVISVNWQNCLPEPDDWVGIYACKGENHTKYDYSDLTRIHTGSLSAGGLNFSEPPPAFKCICLVAVMNRVDSGSTSQYDLLILEIGRAHV